MDLLKILDTKPVPTIVDSQILGVSGDVSGDYWLPATMCLYQKELADQIVSLHYSDILRYFETDDYKEDVVLESMRTMCLNSELVATHPFLLIDHCMPKSLITRDIPAHLAETSGKFTVIRDLINLVQKYETNTAIVCRPGRTMDLLEALLLGNKINIKRYDGQSIKTKAKKPRDFPCTCHLFPSSGYDPDKFPIVERHQFDMLLCVDPSVDTSKDYIQRILKHVRTRGRKGRNSTLQRAPIVRLATINSVDHCYLFFSKRYPVTSRTFLERVTAGVCVLRDSVGTLPPDLRPIYSQHLRYLVEWLENPRIPWPLPDVYPVKNYTSMDVERSLLSEVRFNQIDNLEDAFASNAKKRTRTKADYQSDLEVSLANNRNSLNNNYGINGNDSSPLQPSFYEVKRLKNDYSTNPTKQDMTQLTGITTGNGDATNLNYHLSSSILTHKLVQAIGQVYVDIDEQVRELAVYKDLDTVEAEHLRYYTKEFEAMQNKLKDCVSSIEKSKLLSEELLVKNRAKFEAIEELEDTIDKLLQGQVNGSNGTEGEKLRSLLIKWYDLKDAYEGELQKNKSMLEEEGYMLEEIKRAQESHSSATKEISIIQPEIDNLRGKTKQKIETAETELQRAHNELRNLEVDIQRETELYANLKTKLSVMLRRLQEMPVPRKHGGNPSKPKQRRK